MKSEDVTTIDDWGFSDTTHAELQRLMTKYSEDDESVLVDLMQYGERVSPEDLAGYVGTVLVGSDGHARVFPPGTLWWMFLERLRALDRGGENDGMERMDA